MVLCLTTRIVSLQICLTCYCMAEMQCELFLENSGRKAREEKPGSFETERGERTRGENGQTVSGS